MKVLSLQQRMSEGFNELARQKQEGAKKVEDAGKGQTDEAKGKSDQPDKRVKNENNEGRRPADDEKQNEEGKFHGSTSSREYGKARELVLGLVCVPNPGYMYVGGNRSGTHVARRAQPEALADRQGNAQAPSGTLRTYPDLPLLLGVCGALASVAYALRSAWHWPLVGDAALMHYVVLLLHAGRAPYTQIVDINLPGTYLLEAMAMRLFGPGAAGLRLYDGALCCAATALFVVLSETGWRSRLCGLLAGLLFTLIHLRDGVIQAGQRDLAMSVLALGALAIYLRWKSLPPTAAVYLFEFIVGVTLTVKPTLAPMAAVPFLWPLHRESSRPGWRGRAGALAVLLLPWTLTLAWLQRRESVAAFFNMLRSIAPAHQSLARKDLFPLLAHAGAPLWWLLIIGLVLTIGLRLYQKAEVRLLLWALLCGLGSFLLQRKGFPYQRYPFLLLALLITFRGVARALSDRRSYVSGLALFALLSAGLVLMPWYAVTVASYDSVAPFRDALAADLVRVGAKQGEVQCLDTVGGCLSTLYRLRVAQSTGFLYDCYAYAGSGLERSRYREAMFAELQSTRPRIIVLSSEFCLEPNPRLERVAMWPELDQLLRTQYQVASRWRSDRKLHWWHQPESSPEYVLYVRREPVSVHSKPLEPQNIVALRTR